MKLKIVSAAEQGKIAGLITDRPWWKIPDKVYVAMTVPIASVRGASKEDCGIGEFPDLAFYYKEVLKKQGVDVVLLLPHNARLDESPYGSVSLFSIDENLIAWKYVPEVVADQNLLHQLKVSREYQGEINHKEVYSQKSRVAKLAWHAFAVTEIGQQTQRAVAFEKFCLDEKSWLNDYAEFMAIHELLKKSSLQWTLQDERVARNNITFEFLKNCYMYTQWIGHQQFSDMIKSIHNDGGKILFDHPMFLAKDSVEVWKNPDYFKQPKKQNSYPGIINAFCTERWRDLALWNWQALAQENFNYKLAPLDYWLARGLDGFRYDALHFAYNFGDGQLTSGDESGDAFVEQLSLLAARHRAFPLAEAFNGQASKIEKHNIVTIDGNWLRLSTHDDGHRKYATHVHETSQGRNVFSPVNLMMGLRHEIEAAHRHSNQRSSFVALTIGDLTGDERILKRMEGTVNGSVSLWRYRVPLLDRKPNVDVSGFIKYWSQYRSKINSQEKQILALIHTDRGLAKTVTATLKAACASFVFNTGTSNSVEIFAASRDWFLEQWGRDTFIALPGLLLANGRFGEARRVMRSFAKLEQNGLIPNRIPINSPAEYNTVDGSLWFIQAIQQYAKYTNDFRFVREMLPVIKNVINGYETGTYYERHGRKNWIMMDKNDGLISSPAQATWMDADPDGQDRPVTARNGKVVEINALWYGNLKFYIELLERFGTIDHKLEIAHYQELAELVKTSFRAKFWNDSLVDPSSNSKLRENCLYDVIEGYYHRGAIRPNQLIAISQGGDLLTPEQQKQVLDSVTTNLLTPYGMRTLDSRDSHYRGRYNTSDPVSIKDQAYHQGTVWPWLMGPYIDATVKVGRNQELLQSEIQDKIRDILSPLVTFLMEHGSINEVFDGDTHLQRPGGTSSQAWSVSEVYRVLYEYGILHPSGKMRRDWL